MDPKSPDPKNPAQFFTNVANLLKSSLHPGAHAQYVHEAVTLLEQMAADSTKPETASGQ
jgi:hypothetical protein